MNWVGSTTISWVVIAYLLSATVSTPIYGKVGDLYGRRVIFQTAILIFLAGSLLAGLAQGMAQLILCRGVQGVGAGGVMTMTFAIVGDVVSPRQRGRYIGLLAGVWAFASVLGPLIGGFIVDNVSWRWVFLINLPVGAIALVVTSSVLHLPVSRQRHRIDVEGACMLVAGVSMLLLVLVWGGTAYPWSSPVISGLALTAFSLLTAFAFWEKRAQEPILPLHLFRNPVFFVSSMLGFLSGVALFGGVIFLPLFLQVVTGVSATKSGLLLLPLTAGIVTGSVGSGRIISRTGRYRIWPIGGFAMATVGMSLLTIMRAETPPLLSSIYMTVLGLGVGATMQVTILAVQNAVDYRNLGVATSTVQFFRQMGGSFGVTVLGAVMNARLARELPLRVPVDALVDVGGEITNLLSSPAAIRSLPPAVASGIATSVEVAINAAFFWSVPLMASGFVVAWWLKEIPLRDTIGAPGRIKEVAEAAVYEPDSANGGASIR